jgi:hypothetical protein
MEKELDNIISLLKQSKASLEHKHGDRIRDIFTAHHSGTVLSKENKALYDKCLTTVGLLDGVQQMLTPPLFTLIDAFFGKYHPATRFNPLSFLTMAETLSRVHQQQNSVMCSRIRDTRCTLARSEVD